MAHQQRKGPAMKALEDRISELKTKLTQAQTKLHQAKARERAAASKAKRAADTRRKILIGGCLLGMIERGQYSEERLLKLLSDNLKRADDRALFNLPPLSLDDTSSQSAAS